MLKGFRLSTRIAIAALAVLIAAGSALIFAEQARLRESYLNERASHLQRSLLAEQVRLSQAIDTLRRDVRFLSNTPPVTGILRASLNNGFDARDGNTRARWEARQQEIFTAFSLAHPDYYRLRYIGIADGGRELVRVERRGDAVAARDRLERNAGHDYFQRTLALRVGEVLLSEFELSADGVQTLRASTPVYGPDGKIFGMLVINLDVRGLLESANGRMPADVEAYISDADGHYLLHPDARRAFRFGANDNIATDFPVLKRLFDPEEDAQMRVIAEGSQLFAAARLHFDDRQPQRFLSVVYRIPDVMADRQLFRLPASYLYVAVLIMLLLGVLALLLLRRTFAPLRRLTVAADRIAAGDRDVVLPQDGYGEVGALSRALASMVRELSRREAEVLRINTELEERVEQRTRDLTFSNEFLQAAIEENRKRQLEAMAQSNRNQVLMATSMDGIHVMDIQGNVIEANDAFCRMLGYSREEIAGMNVADWDAQWSAEELHEHFKSLVGRTERFETVHRRKDGTLINVEISTAGVEIDGQSYMFASSRDITARKREEMLNRQHELVILAAIDGYWMTDMQGYLLEANQAYANLSGYPIEELIGMHISQLEAMERPEDVREHMDRIIAQGHDRFETRHRRKDGQVIDIEVSVTYLAGAGRLFVFCRDITPRKQDEQALRIAAAAFETQDAILITDAGANILRVNHAFEQITGYSAAEVLGKNPRIMSSGRHTQDFYREMWQRLTHSGSWAGEVWDKRKNGQVYPRWMTITAVRDARQQVTHYVGIFTDITARKQAEEEIRNLAFYDPLTKLPNRRLFLDRFNAALPASQRNRNYGAVLFIDLDRFKQLNDTYGHECGDLLLIDVAARIKSCVREMDTVARLGGDEFVVLFEALSGQPDEASHKVGLVAEKIRTALSEPYRLKEHEHHSSPSIGICLFHGNDEPVDLLLQHADMAMYQAKESGRNAVRFYDQAMQQNVASHAELGNDLRRAVERGQLQLHYQIQVDGDGLAIGAEALLRWMHPQRGLLLPGDFIPLAEESELILTLDQWVLDTACQQLFRWCDDERTCGLTMAVNISARLFARADFVAKMDGLLHAHRIKPERLLIELTERMVLDDLPGAAQKLRELKALGVSLSMDDFGSGYSSLTYLKQLPLDQLKISQSFVQGISEDGNDALLVQAIIDLASSFGLHVLAEGVETEAQLAFLKHQNCMAYQGFLFGRALPIEEFNAGLKR